VETLNGGCPPIALNYQPWGIRGDEKTALTRIKKVAGADLGMTLLCQSTSKR
jgi:hypothetical protein